MPTLCLKKDQKSGGSPEPKSSHGKCVLRSGCKINLYLEITGRLPNGYHSLKSFMLPLLPTQPPFDTMRVRYAWRNRNSDCHGHANEHQCDNQRKYTACPGLTLTSNAPYLDLQNNTLQKAYALYAAEVTTVPDLEIYLEKGVPEGAGLGGGSANAATLLLFLQSCLDEAGLNPLDPQRLNGLAALVGADVPFFLLNQPAWAYGIGDKLVPAPFPFEADRLEDNRLMTGHVATEQTETGRLETQQLLLVCPPISVSTAWAYAAWDKWQEQNYADPASDQTFDPVNQQTRFLTSGKAQAISSCSAKHAANPRFDNCFSGSYAAQEFDNYFFNSFEAVVFPRYPELAEIKGQLLELGAEAALMSGSGSSVFGLFRRAAEADRASEILRATGLTVYNRAIHAGVSPSW